MTTTPRGASSSVVSLLAGFSLSWMSTGHRGDPVVSGKEQESDSTMTYARSALTALIGDVLADSDLAHSDVFRRMLRVGL